MKKTRVWLILSLVQTGLAAAAAEGTSQVQLVVHVENYANVASHELQSAVDQTTRAFRAAGVHTEWRFQAQSGRTTGGRRDLRILLLPAEMTARKCAADEIGKAVLGTSSRDAARAWIFADRITEFANRLGLTISDILGQVITHELGHLLLNDRTDNRAVMREQVLPTGAGYFAFTRDQAERIRAQLWKGGMTALNVPR